MKYTTGFVILVLFVLANCQTDNAPNSDLVGSWIESQKTCAQRTSQTCAIIELNSNGEFQAEDLPIEYVTSFYETPKIVSVTGTWEIDAAPFVLWEPDRVLMTIDPDEDFPKGFRFELFVALGRNGLFLGLPDDKNLLFQPFDNSD